MSRAADRTRSRRPQSQGIEPEAGVLDTSASDPSLDAEGTTRNAPTQRRKIPHDESAAMALMVVIAGLIFFVILWSAAHK